MSTLRTNTVATIDGATSIPVTDLARLSALAASTGAAGIGYGSGTVASALAGVSASAGASPDTYGAVGNGVADDTAALVAALATGLPVTGGQGKVYAINALTWPAVLRMSNIRFKLLTPNAVDRRGIFQTGGTLCHLVNVVVDRNGSGIGGQMGNSAGIYISNCPDVRIERCEVTGNNYGDGITVTDSVIRLYHNYVHDMTYGNSSSAAQTDDVMQGFFLSRCTGERVGNRAERLQGQWTGQAVFARYTRGFALAGCYDMDALGDSTDVVDQGFDYSGGENNRRISTTACRANNSYTWGFKAANTVTDSVYTGCIAYRCGLGGFVASAPNTTLSGVTNDQLTQNITYVGCKAIQTGFGEVWALSSIQASFQALTSTAYPGYPRGIKWIGCQSYMGGGNKVGFKNDVPVGGLNALWNEAINCDSRDHTVAGFQNTNSGLLIRQASGSQSIPAATSTVLTLGAVVSDRMSAGGSNTIQRGGLYMLSAGVQFTGSANGVRTLRILVNGNAIPGGTFIVAPNSSSTGVYGSVMYMLATGNTVRVEVIQDSGAALTATNGYLSIVEMSKGQME